MDDVLATSTSCSGRSAHHPAVPLAALRRWSSAPCSRRCGWGRSRCSRTLGTVYVTVVRNTPLLVVFIFVFDRGAQIGIDFASSASTATSPGLQGVIALTVYTSAFVCEAVRSGVNAVPLGQAEAARAIGLTFGGSRCARSSCRRRSGRRCRRWPAC